MINYSPNLPMNWVFPPPLEVGELSCGSNLIANAVAEIRLLTQAPVEMIYSTVFASCAQVLQGVADVESPFGKTIPLSLYILILGGSGERKSTVENLASKGIKKFCKEQRAMHKGELKRYKIKLEIHKKKLDV
jgi:hypothetical protein